jgi:hypothetical protein
LYAYKYAVFNSLEYFDHTISHTILSVDQEEIEQALPNFHHSQVNQLFNTYFQPVQINWDSRHHVEGAIQPQPPPHHQPPPHQPLLIVSLILVK